MKNEDIIILEDNSATASYLKFILSMIYHTRRIFIFESVVESIAWLSVNEPKLALIDLGLPDGSGLELLKAIKTKNKKITAVIVTIMGDDDTVFSALSLGADGYILKDEEENFIHRALEKIEQGEPPLSASIALRMMKHFHKEPVEESEVKLSPREVETLKLIATGMTVPEVASHLGLSRQTVAGYVKNVYQKLQISSRAEATREALRLKII